MSSNHKVLCYYKMISCIKTVLSRVCPLSPLCHHGSPPPGISNYYHKMGKYHINICRRGAAINIALIDYTDNHKLYKMSTSRVIADILTKFCASEHGINPFFLETILNCHYLENLYTHLIYLYV